jgi:probable HAF family extracellular repeat protein
MRRPIARFVVLAVVLLVAGTVGGRFEAAQSDQDTESQRHARYQITHLGSLGGASNRGNSINNLGWVAGFSNLPDGRSRHAMLWIQGWPVELGTLGGPNSNVAWPVKNTVGLVPGIAQTNTLQPRGETWSCRAFFPPPDNARFTCRAVVWELGVMRLLPLLGGDNSFATGANNHRQIVGWSQKDVVDSTCATPQVLQFRAVIWGPGADQIRELLPLPLPGHTSSAATAINDSGQVVGISGRCDQAVGRHTARHAVLWENGQPTNIGDFGSVTWNTPMAINERGDVVGFAGTPGEDPDNPVFQAFLWTRGRGIRRLDPLPDFPAAEAHGINEWRVIVGSSCAGADCRAVVWQTNGDVTDLNELVAPGYRNVLVNAQDINDDGLITGRAFDPTTQTFQAFVAVPTPRNRQ